MVRAGRLVDGFGAGEGIGFVVDVGGFTPPTGDVLTIGVDGRGIGGVGADFRGAVGAPSPGAAGGVGRGAAGAPSRGAVGAVGPLDVDVDRLLAAMLFISPNIPAALERMSPGAGVANFSISRLIKCRLAAYFSNAFIMASSQIR